MPTIAMPRPLPTCWALANMPAAVPASAAGTSLTAVWIRVGTAMPMPAFISDIVAISVTPIACTSKTSIARMVASRPATIVSAPISGSRSRSGPVTRRAISEAAAKAIAIGVNASPDSIASSPSPLCM